MIDSRERASIGIYLDSPGIARYTYAPPRSDKDLFTMSFLSFVLLGAATYFIWRITDQLPDLIFRISEIQRDVAELRRTLTDAPAASSTGGAAPARRIEPSPGAPAADTVS